MFLVHNITGGRVTFRLFSLKEAPEGTPNWRIRRDARQNTINVAIDPHVADDLEKYGFTEDELLRQPDVLDFMRKGFLRRVVDGDYKKDPFTTDVQIVTRTQVSQVLAPVQQDPTSPEQAVPSPPPAKEEPPAPTEAPEPKAEAKEDDGVVTSVSTPKPIIAPRSKKRK